MSRHGPAVRVATPAPVFSIVVPTRNRPAALDELLGALTRQTFPAGRFEVIVVDDDGAVPLAPVLDRFRGALRLHAVRTPRALGCAGARQMGTTRARGTMLVFTDDDCVPRTGWLAALDAARRRHPGAALGGPIVNGLPDSLLAESLQLVVNRFTAHQNFDAEPAFFATANLAVPRERYEAVGGLDAGWGIAGGEDRDLCHRWTAAGHRVVGVPEAIVAHRPRLTTTAFARKFFSYGRGAAAQRRRNGPGRRPLSSSALHALFLPLAPFGTYPGTTAARMSLLILLSQLCTATGFAREMARRVWREARPARSPSVARVLWQ